MKNSSHIPVLLNESLESLEIKSGGLYIDCTLGAGGHSEEILKRGGKVLGIEADNTMLAIAKERLVVYCPTLVQGNFANISSIAKDNNFYPVDGVLFDLGVSSLHYTDLKRGFSVKGSDEDLDMRLEPTNTDITAAKLLNILPEDKLFDLFLISMQRSEARLAAKKISRFRQEKLFGKVSDLTNIFHSNLPEIFLALRIAVNDEFHTIERGLKGAIEVLKNNCNLVVISFHSGEDKLVFHLMKSFEDAGLGTLVTKKPIVPSDTEILENNKSRSALMRVLKKSKLYE